MINHLKILISIIIFSIMSTIVNKYYMKKKFKDIKKNPKSEGLTAIGIGIFFISVFIVPIIHKNPNLFFYIFYLLLISIMILSILHGIYRIYISKEPFQYDPLRVKLSLISIFGMSILTIIMLPLPKYTTIIRIISLVIFSINAYLISRKN